MPAFDKLLKKSSLSFGTLLVVECLLESFESTGKFASTIVGFWIGL